MISRVEERPLDKGAVIVKIAPLFSSLSAELGVAAPDHAVTSGLPDRISALSEEKSDVEQAIRQKRQRNMNRLGEICRKATASMEARDETIVAPIDEPLLGRSLERQQWRDWGWNE